MAVAIGDIVRITARMLLDGAFDMQNVYHFRVVAEPGSPGDDDFMNDVDDIMNTLYLLINAHFSTRISYLDIIGQNVTKDELLPSRSWPTLTVGIETGELLPEMNAACVFHRTIKPRVRVSKFLGGFTEGANLGGLLNTGVTVALVAFGAFLQGNIVSGGTTLVYVAFNRLLSTSTDAGNPVVPARWRTQRRRRISVGS